ncbi:TVP38/TMEM64 family protein [Agrilactobacillus yilanensis]|uniref:TVP38/TMEM64 family protein n=1 Tax=Agrilactobacillus yilanensis TaxID=2485997 RepID=A0ABW4J5Y7_9LACO|nr:VTT domain-containing protein [Agrilactobacillus yilanensis]
MHLSKRQLLRIAGGLAVLLLGLLIWRYQNVWQHWHTQTLTQAKIVAMVRQQRGIDVFLVVPLLVCFSIIPGAPVSTIGVVAGICFGKGWGALLNVIGITLGNLISQRVFGLIEARHVKDKSNKIVQGIAHMRHPLWGITIGYTIPFIPTSLVSMATVQASVRQRPLALATLLGSIPTAILYAVGGDALIKANFKTVMIVAIVVILLAGLLWVIRHDRQEKTA